MKQSCVVSKALKHVRDTFTKYASQEPVSYRTEKAKVENLYRTVTGFEWAKVPFMQSFAQEPLWIFHQLFTALDAS